MTKSKPRKRLARRSVSIPVATYWRLKKLAALDVQGSNPSQVVDRAINAAADKHGVPSISRDQALALLPVLSPREERAFHDPAVSQHFTF